MAKNHYTSQIFLECTCEGVSLQKWNSLMKEAVKANGSKIRQLIKEQIPSLYHALALNFYNPYEANCKRTKTHYIYVHSSIEYFLRRFL
jgi:hypothetical protein